MNRVALLLTLMCTIAPTGLFAQSDTSSSSMAIAETNADDGTGEVRTPIISGAVAAGPFSRLAFGAGVSPLGVGLQVATNINEHFTVRATGNTFMYSRNFNTNGLNLNANLNLASAGVALDVYPFHSGFRISPGVLIYNTSQVTASDNVAGGTSFTLNDQTFYSANANATTGATPVFGNARLGLNATKPAFTITTGWGNMIPRNDGHWSFPFEIGVALIGAPPLTANLGGWACYDQAQTECTNIASTTDPIAIAVQSDLKAQIATWKNDLDPLKTYPIVSIGVAYSFHVRGQ
jgi:hypothetical protein